MKNLHIDELDISIRAYQCLKQNKLFRLEDISKKSNEELLALHGSSDRTVKEIVTILTEKGWRKKGYWNTEEFMDSIGYERIPYNCNGDHISKYQNKTGTQSTFYGPMGRGKRLIHFNTDFIKDYVFVQIEEDGGTRKVFHGGCKDAEAFITILNHCY